MRSSVAVSFTEVKFGDFPSGTLAIEVESSRIEQNAVFAQKHDKHAKKKTLRNELREGNGKYPLILIPEDHKEH
jgi:hypothetical protein